MKKYLTFLLALTYCVCISAQVPQAFSFQGQASNTDGSPIGNKLIGIEASILQGSANGQIQYTERHSITTNSNGLYSISIGSGQVVSGEFQSINWSAIPMFLSIAIDTDNSSTFVPIGATQLLSVPYALKAGEADIKPSIYVRSNPTYRPAFVYNGENYNGQGNITYNYQWIHGVPENVFVEFQGLPDNVNIYTNAIGGYSIPSVKSNSSKVDTIIDGILIPNSFLGVADKSIAVPKGKYPLLLVFRTSEKTLASLPFDLFVKDSYYEECFPVLPLVKTLKSNSCSEIDSQLVPQITLEKVDLNTLNLTNIFNVNKKDIIDVHYPDNCNIAASVLDSVSGFSYFNRNIAPTKTKITHSFQLNKVTGESKSCVVIYE